MKATGGKTSTINRAESEKSRKSIYIVNQFHVKTIFRSISRRLIVKKKKKKNTDNVSYFDKKSIIIASRRKDHSFTFKFNYSI